MEKQAKQAWRTKSGEPAGGAMATGEGPNALKKQAKQAWRTKSGEPAGGATVTREGQKRPGILTPRASLRRGIPTPRSHRRCIHTPRSPYTAVSLRRAPNAASPQSPNAPYAARSLRRAPHAAHLFYFSCLHLPAGSRTTRSLARRSLGGRRSLASACLPRCVEPCGERCGLKAPQQTQQKRMENVGSPST